MAETTKQILTLNMQEDFAGKLVAGRPVQAIAELIWNGFDAEATRIKVTAETDDLRLRSVTIQDNGHGMSRSDVVHYFENLGGSWKKANNASKNGIRHLHGKEGRGRLRALAIGRVVEWSVTGKNSGGKLETFEVTIIRDDVRSARITEAVSAAKGDRPGTRVRISEMDKDWRLDAPGVIQEIAESFALYMTEYPDVSIMVDGLAIDPKAAISDQRTYELEAIGVGGDSFPASLQVIEWKRQTERMLYLCDEGGLPLHRILQ